MQEQWIVHQRERIKDVELGLVRQDNRVTDEFRQSALQQPEFLRILYKGSVGRVVIEVSCLQEAMRRIRHDCRRQGVERNKVGDGVRFRILGCCGELSATDENSGGETRLYNVCPHNLPWPSAC